MTCEGDCDTTFFKFISLCGNEDGLMKWLEDHGVISYNRLCSLCQNPLKLDGRGMFFCGKRVQRKKRCTYRTSMKKGTWFGGSKLTIEQICKITATWACLRHPLQQFLIDEMMVGSNTVVDWFSFCREVCVNWCVTRREKIGGPGVIVEVDEAEIGRRKHHRGLEVDGKWVFGGIERESKKLFIVGVPDRTKVSLLTIIKEWILPGTTIMSDCLQSYSQNDERFLDLTINHSVNFVSAESSLHTQNIEQVWREVRAYVPLNGGKDCNFEGYWCEFLWKREFPDHTRRIHELFMMISKQYTPGMEHQVNERGDGDEASAAEPDGS